MMMNLFSIFDPSSSFNSHLNWFSLGLGIGIFPMVKYSLNSRYSKVWSMIFLTLQKELNLLLPYFSKNSVLIFLALFFFILFNNSMGLLPYMFTATSHMTITLGLALPLWLGYFCYGWVKNTKYMLAHLVPQGTPALLMPFMVLIESVSTLLRPGTLAVRLAANMIAGHLLLTLVSGSASIFSSDLSVSLTMLSTTLMSLEMAVAFIQAYVFMILSIMYTSEI